MDTEAAQSQYARAHAYFKDGRHAEALVLLTALARQFPDNKDVLFARARCLARMGRGDEAREICTELAARFNHSGAQKLMVKLDPRESPNFMAAAPAVALDPEEHDARPVHEKYQLSNKDRFVAFVARRSFIIVVVGLAIIIGVYIWQLKLLGSRDWGSAEFDDSEMRRPAISDPDAER